MVVARLVSRSLRLPAFVALALLAALSTHLHGQASTLVPAGSTWRYLDDGSNPGSSWRSVTFDDSAWRTGAAQLGYGDGDEATVVGYGPDPNAKYITTYFRQTFQVSNPALIGSLNLRILRDDGAVVYLNGSEVFRTNMPAGTISSTTLASSTVIGADESAFVSAAISPSLLVAGSNLIAVEVHQADATSSDVSFDLELTAGPSAAVTRGPYLQLGTPSSIVVRWRTSAPVIGAVQYGPAPGVVSGSAIEASERTDHELTVTGLAPDTLYYYSIGTPTVTLAGDSTFYFRTSPLPGTERPVRVWVIGDSGTADSNVQAVRDAYTTFTGSTPTDLWLMLGDNAYNDGLDNEYQAAVFSMFKSMLRKTVLWPAYGNHDGYGSDSATQTGPYYDIFTLPTKGQAGGVASGTEAYYSFNYANIHFICLESFETDRSPNGTMLTWLQHDLAANTQPWVIAYFHHPPYSKGSHDSDAEIELIEMRQNALPILENAGVDLVLTGHSHSYERSFLIDGHYGDSTTFTESTKKDGGSGRPDQSGAYSKSTYGMAPHQGTVYVVAGTGGQTGGGTLNHPAMYLSQSVLGSLVLDVTGTRLDATFIDSTGGRRDYFSIVKGTTTSTPSTSPAYGGTPVALPGTIEAENFDEGGQSVAYYDTTAGNKGGSYRITDVDIAPSADAGGGYYVGWTRAAEWLKYTVNVASAGTYSLETRVANVGSGATFHVEVDGVNQTGSIAVPDTGAWDAWQTLTTPAISLPAGEHVIRVALDAIGSGGGVGNFNWFRFSAGTSSSSPTTAYGGTRVTIPGAIEAENFDQGGQSVAYYDTTPGNKGGSYRATDVDLGPTGDAGGGYYVGWTRAGEWLTYSVTVGVTGTYTLSARVANIGTGGSFHVEVDGVDSTGRIMVPDTGAWDIWQTITTSPLALSGGEHVIRVVLDTIASGGAVGNFNWFRLSSGT